MEPKWSQKGVKKSMIFWLGFRTPLETSAELRGDCECSRGRHTFSSRPPRAAPYYQRLLYNNKQGRVACGMTERAPLGRMTLQDRSGAIKRGKFERGWQVEAVDDGKSA